ncbi:Indeterminate(ID)-domain 12 [Rhynchospora pubera]|uniref:Protein EARLY HEADING DATE 2 n=1 Tax=Rhynchospora pubera TaxID=906938 RepID=A0AAV8HXA0_9POAL|nr:Indeterminate(ID)-domain 12 [Rhynchospora pubera]
MDNISMFSPSFSFSNKSISEEASGASCDTRLMIPRPINLSPLLSPAQFSEPVKTKRKRNLPGNPDPDAEVVALSPKTLVTTNQYVCEICNKGFQRDQNLQLHRRGHNLPWKLRQRTGSKDGGIKKRVYVCPEPTCVHHHPSRALGDLTGIKKHYSRKHGEKKWRCERCGKRYAVQSDWKAHVKGCGTREYRCDCGILFSRKDSLVTHRAFCDALAEESARLFSTTTDAAVPTTTPLPFHPSLFTTNPNPNPNLSSFQFVQQNPYVTPSITSSSSTDQINAIALLQRSCNPGPTSYNTRKASTTSAVGVVINEGFNGSDLAMWQAENLTRDFLGVATANPEEVTRVDELVSLPLIFG